jgi:hypothetical protein
MQNSENSEIIEQIQKIQNIKSIEDFNIVKSQLIKEIKSNNGRINNLKTHVMFNRSKLTKKDHQDYKNLIQETKDCITEFEQLLDKYLFDGAEKFYL